MPDPFADRAILEHLPPDVERAAFADQVLNAQGFFSLDKLQLALYALPDTEEKTPGSSGKEASLQRMGLTRMPPGVLKRFMKHVEVHMLDYVTPCWLWTGGTHDKGYGRFHLGFIDEVRVTAYSHRIAFEHWIGTIPPGYIGDHRCNHKVCCNPTHIWPETNTANLRLADQRRPWQRRNQFSKE